MDARLLETSEREFAKFASGFRSRPRLAFPAQRTSSPRRVLSLRTSAERTFINGHEPTNLRQRICRIYASGPLVYEHAPREIRNDRELRMFPPRRLAGVQTELSLAQSRNAGLETGICWRCAGPHRRGKRDQGRFVHCSCAAADQLGDATSECQSSPAHDGKWWSYRNVDFKRCWYQGRPGRSKDLLHWAKKSPPPLLTRPDPAIARPLHRHSRCFSPPRPSTQRRR